MRQVLAMPGNEILGQAVAKHLGAQHGIVQMHRFPDGEGSIRLPNDVGGCDVDILCTLARPDAQFLSLAFTAQTARELGARRVRLIAPYLAYMRQDARFHPREAVSARGFAALLSNLFDALITVDPHLHRISSLEEVFSIPAKVVSAAPLIGGWIKSGVSSPLIVGPDRESEQWARAVAGAANAPYAILSKTRRDDRSVLLDVPDLSRWAGRKIVLVDDIASTGQTLVDAATRLTALGFAKPVCVVVHALCGAEDGTRIKAATDGFVSTDTVAHASNAISVAQLISDAASSP